jgi:dTDP-4-amino-4,6-dideoxygalactose transaminase
LIESRLVDFEKRIDIQQKHAQLLQDLLAPGVFLLSSNASGNAFQFALRFQTSSQRDAMSTYLFEQGIDTAKYLDTIEDEARADYGYIGDCPNAEKLAKTTLLVPIHYTLSNRDIHHIAEAINTFPGND